MSNYLLPIGDVNCLVIEPFDSYIKRINGHKYACLLLDLFLFFYIKMFRNYLTKGTLKMKH